MQLLTTHQNSARDDTYQNEQGFSPSYNFTLLRLIGSLNPLVAQLLGQIQQ